MSLLFPLLTILEASGAILYLWKPSETGLSLTRLGFVFLIFCITGGLLFGWGWTIKKSNQIKVQKKQKNAFYNTLLDALKTKKSKKMITYIKK